MAKITRSVLKTIIKECLVEILLEGIDGEDADILEESLERPQVAKKTRSRNKPDPMIEIQKRRDALDSQKVQHRAQQTQESITNLTDNPLMQDIFADTAMTTLQEQVERKGKMSHVAPTGAAAVVAENNPSDLFSGANNWADLAFSSTKPGE